MQNYRISEISIAHYDQMIALWQNTENMGISQADSRENIAAFLQRNPAPSFCAWDAAQLVGTILCGHDGRRAAIYHLAVHKDYRGQGIGKALITRSLAGLQKAGIERCHIHVYAENENGLAFWQKQGWFFRPELELLSIDIAVG